MNHDPVTGNRRTNGYVVSLGCALVEITMLAVERFDGSPMDGPYRYTWDSVRFGGLVMFVLAACVPLAWRRSRPWIVLLIEVVLVLPASWLQIDSLVMIPLLIAYWSVMTVMPDRAALAWTVGLVAVMASSAFLTRPSDLLAEVVGRMAMPVLVGSCAYALRSRGESRRARQREAVERHRSALFAAQRDEALRRSRIAGELHDSVGHGLTTIIALSEGLSGKTGDPALEEALAGINEVSRESLADTRKAVRALTETTDGHAADVESRTCEQHSWDDIRPILRHARSSGIIVTFIETGTRSKSPAQADLCFDVTREAITNAMRHGRATSHIGVSWNHAADGSVTAVIGNDTQSTGEVNHHGTGLTRLDRRIRSVGGTFEYGPGADGGEWKVRAVVPAIEPDERTRP